MTKINLALLIVFFSAHSMGQAILAKDTLSITDLVQPAYKQTVIAKGPVAKTPILYQVIIRPVHTASRRTEVNNFHTNNAAFEELVSLERVDFYQNFVASENIFNDDFFIKNCYFGKALFLDNKFNGFIFNLLSASELTLTGVQSIRSAGIINSIIDNLSIMSGIFEEDVSILQCRIDSIVLNDNHFKGNLSFVHTTFNTTPVFFAVKTDGIIYFNDCTFNTPLKMADLQYFETRVSLKNCKSGSGFKIRLNLEEAYIEQIDLDYENFELDFSDSTSENYKRQIYINLLENFKNRGQMDSYRRLDLEYKKLFNNFFVHAIQTIWWNYGYEKNRIFMCTGILLALFTLITMIFYKQLQITYEIENVKTSRSLFINSFLYTCVIFWAWKIDIGNLKFKVNLPAALYIIGMYTMGIICLAYMVNYIIQH